MSEGTTINLSLGGEPTRVLAFLPAGISITDAAKIMKAMDRAFPGSVAQTAGLPAGMAMAILRKQP